MLIITVCCLPIMLCVIPCMFLCCGGSHHEEVPDEFMGVQAHKNEEDDGLLGAGGEPADDGDMKDDIRDVEEMLKNHSPKSDGNHGAGEVFIH